MAGRPYHPQRRPVGYPRPRPKSSSDGGMIPAILGLALVMCLVVFGLNKAGVSFGGGESGNGGTSAEQHKADYGPAILAEAKKYDSKPYVMGGGHPPKGYDGGGLDCSGLVNVAVLAATGVNEDRLAQGFKDSEHWSKISFAEAGPGDIMYRLKSQFGGAWDHVVIVEENGGDGNLTVFEAQGSDTGILTTRKNHYRSFSGALRFKR